MRIRVLGGGWYGCHITLALLQAGHDAVLHEVAPRLFSGASGAQPSRLHLGFHYPRSKLTRAACQDHYRRFMNAYGFLTRGVPINIYAVADKLSYVDFGNYTQSLKDEVEFVRIAKPDEFGLQNVEGAVLTGERHVIIREAREYFAKQLEDKALFKAEPSDAQAKDFQLTVDCTFCARDSMNVDRYEPCATYLLRGPIDKAVTIMDGPFPSLYPWDEKDGICSLTSANLTPLSKECKTYYEARKILDDASGADLAKRGHKMMDLMAQYYPAILEYQHVGWKLAVRAMPLSGADARLVDLVKVDERTLRIRASKLDAIFYAEDLVKEHIKQCSR